MTLTLQLPPELEEQLRKEAARRDVSAEEYAQVLLKNILTNLKMTGGWNLPLYITATTEEWIREFHKLVESFADIKAPPIPDEELRREHLYEDRI